MTENDRSDWFDDYLDGEDEDDFPIDEYDITASPNDFNVMTLNSLVESDVLRIPAFQRNFVWDLKRASKLIESLVLGLPVPQLFLYEQERNKFLVIDGQQRLMSIYYFIKKRFPRRDKRSELRTIFDLHGRIPEEVLDDDTYFQTFNLRLPEKLPNRRNKFKGLNYGTLGNDYRTRFNLRPVRNIVVRQNHPSNDDSSIYEIFNRLNSGGVNLRPQEIRTSMYHSAFYDMLYKINLEDGWRKILRSDTPDLHMKDIEILLRGFAMLVDGKNYAPSMVKFLNRFSEKCRHLKPNRNTYLTCLFDSFLRACSRLPGDAFTNKYNGRFNIALYEATFVAVSAEAFAEERLIDGMLDPAQIQTLEKDMEFVESSQKRTTNTVNVKNRLGRAQAIVEAL